jgi:transcriptional regulator with XRE-family HTH domain
MRYTVVCQSPAFRASSGTVTPVSCRYAASFMPGNVRKSHYAVNIKLGGFGHCGAVRKMQMCYGLELDLGGGNLPGIVNRIRELRKAAGLNQQQLAERMGVDRTALLRLERGEQKITDEYLGLLAAALNLAPIEFISDPGDLARDEVEREALEMVRRMHPEAARQWLLTARHLRRKE